MPYDTVNNPVHLIIIGGGPAGYVAALHASARGARVTLIEAKELGGTCLNRGCIPTKTLISACSLMEKLRSASRFGIDIQGEIAWKWRDVQANMDKVVGTLVKGVGGLLSNRRVEFIHGHARLTDRRTVEIAGHGMVSGDFILICSGSRAARPPIFPFDGCRVVTSDELLKWDSLPLSLAIIGEGIIACEFAFALKALGTDVTMIGMEDRPLPTLDSDISTLVAREMKKRGIRFIGGSVVDGLDINADQVEISARGIPLACAERALVCVGRVPNSDRLNLEAINLITGPRGEIRVDEFMRTSVPGVYAAGDVTGGVMLAHAASAQAKLAVDHMLGNAPATIDEMTIPWAIFTSPEIACVGMAELAAKKRGIEVRCGKFDIRGLGKAQAIGELAGTVKVVADANTRRLLGVHIIGPHATDLIHEAVLLIGNGLPTECLVRTIHAHPTLSEAVLEATEDVFGQATHKILKSELGVAYGLSA
ncbi:MAG: dihydrolipoyl dehydrogenase [Burkholderiales bacterium]